MKKINRIYSSLLLALMIMAAPLTQAQSPDGRERGPRMNKEQRMEKMQQELGLSEQQSAEMKAIHEKYDPQFEALRSVEGERDREKMRELHRAMRAEVKEVLTEEQRLKMKEMHAERRGGHHGKMHRGHGDHSFKGDHRRKGNKEVHAYMKANVIPVLKEQRAKLDEQMSAQDKAEVTALRAELKAMRPEMKEARKEKREIRKEGERPSEEQREAMKAFREKRHAIMDKAGQIAAKYQSELEALHAEILPQAEQWKSDIEAIKVRAAAEHRPEGNKAEKGQAKSADCKARCEGKEGREGREKGEARSGKKHRGHHGHHGHHASPMGRKMDPAHFILMDPNSSSYKMATSGETPGAAKMNIYPNPSSNQNTISYEVKTTGQVRIEMLDNTGQVVRQIMSEKRQAGNYTLDVDISSLSSGVYFYRITDASGARSKNFTVTK